MRLTEADKIPLAECRKRALRHLSQNTWRRCVASEVGTEIWPNSKLRAQGLGGAASRILKGLEKDGLVQWSANDGDWGWYITRAGRKALEE